MRQKPRTKQSHTEKTVKDIQVATRQQHLAQVKIKMVPEEQKGDELPPRKRHVHLKKEPGHAPPWA